VDIGIKQDKDFGQLLTFADLNSDKYADMVTLTNDLSTLQIHIFDDLKQKFTFWKEIDVDGCQKIYNLVAGRSVSQLRLFITCTNGAGKTVIKVVDRKEIKLSTGEDDYEFYTPRFQLQIEQDSQPFIGDLNGDFLEDILYTDPSSMGLQVAF